MAKLQNLEFMPLNVSGDNYLQWALDTKIALKSKGLANCIEKENKADEMSRYKAISLIRHHLNESLKNQYLTIENPLELWDELKARYDHQKTILLPTAKYDWKNLRIQDYKSVEEYNSELFKIVSILRLCGEEVTQEELIDKTLSTFHSTNVLLSQQYREKGFKTYANLVSCMLLAEKNNELLLLNSAMRPPGSKALPEANKAEKWKEPQETKETNYVHSRYRGRGRGRGRGGRGSDGQGSHQGGRGRGNYNRGRGRGISKPQHKAKSTCHRCGRENHWAKACRTPKYLCEAYQEWLKKNPEANLVHVDGDDHENDDQVVHVDGDDDFDHENDDQMDYETSDCLKEDN